MGKINTKSLIFAIFLGIISWLWAFIIVGSAFFDYATNQPILDPDMGVYATMLMINLMITLIILALYLWKYEQNNPIVPENWLVDAFFLGLILCAINFLLDAIFFGIMGRNLVAYFWIETTTGYFYPAIILETMIIAYLIYGREK